MVWLKAAVLGGLAAGVVTWLVQLVVDFSVGQNTLFFELTSGAAFTILLIFIPATISVFLGRLLAGREAKKKLEASDAERDRERHDRHLVGAGSSSQSTSSQSTSTPQREQQQWSGDNADTEVFSAVDPNADAPVDTSKKHRDNT